MSTGFTFPPGSRRRESQSGVSLSGGRSRMGLYLLDNSCNISFYKLHERTRLDYIHLFGPPKTTSPYIRRRTITPRGKGAGGPGGGNALLRILRGQAISAVEGSAPVYDTSIRAKTIGNTPICPTRMQRNPTEHLELFMYEREAYFG